METADLLESLGLEEVPTPAILGTGAAGGSVSRMRARHHGLARLLAEGKPPREAAYVMGYAPSTVSALLADPAFRELVEYYKAQINAEYLDMHHKLGILAATATEVLQDRLEESPKSFTNNELRQIIGDACDRSVAPARGPGSAPAVSINVKFVEAGPSASVIDVVPEKPHE